MAKVLVYIINLVFRMNKKLLFLEAIKDNRYSKFIKKMPDVEFVEDTWIVKGLKLEPPVTNKKQFGKYEFDIADAICEFKKLKIENIEFHNCNIALWDMVF